MQKLPFAEFLANLTRQGFVVGVDQHLRLHTLLHRLGPDCPPARLKSLLCPLFATNAKQQQQFYRAFDAYFAVFDPQRAKKEAEAEAERKAAEQAEKERREKLDLKKDEEAYKIKNGILIETPVYCIHSRGKNWLARIALNPKAPGGLDREFCEKTKGQGRYILPADLRLGDAIEFGADYYTGSGKRNPNRWYGVIVRIENTFIVLRQASDGIEAIEAGEEMVGNSG